MKSDKKSTTPWGPARVLEEVKVPQRAGEKRFASTVQLLEGKDGEQLIRFALFDRRRNATRPRHAAGA